MQLFLGWQREEILADELVQEILFVKPGEKVPADGRLIRVYNLKVNEAA